MIEIDFFRFLFIDKHVARSRIQSILYPSDVNTKHIGKHIYIYIPVIRFHYLDLFIRMYGICLHIFAFKFRPSVLVSNTLSLDAIKN